MYEDGGIPVTRHLRPRRMMDSNDEIVADSAAIETLRGHNNNNNNINNTDSGLGIEKDELIPRDGSCMASTTRPDSVLLHHQYLYHHHQQQQQQHSSSSSSSYRFDSGCTDSGFESYRSERLTSSDLSSWRISTDLTGPLSPTEEQTSAPLLPSTTSAPLPPFSDKVTEGFERLRIDGGDRSSDANRLTSYCYYPLVDEEEAPETIPANSDGDTILHIAIIHEVLDLAWTIIRQYPRELLWEMVNTQNYLLQTPLHLAVITRQPDLVRALVLAGALVDVRDRRGNTALHLACERGDSACAAKILNPVIHVKEMDLHESMEIHRQDLELINYEGQTCMHLATLSQDVKLVRLLKDFGADVNAPECKSGRSPLHYAVEIQNLDVVRCLLVDCRASTESKTFGGLTPIQYAYSRSKKVVDLLLTYGASNVGFPPSDSESDSSSDELTKMETLDDDSELDICINGRPLQCR